MGTLTAESLISDALMSTGSTWIKKEDLLSYMVRRHFPKQEMNSAITAGKIIHYVDSKNQSYLTTSYINRMENMIAANIMRLMYVSYCKKISESYIRSLVAEFEINCNHGRHLHEHQVDGVIMVVNNNFSVLTGGPGTGKTTVLSAIAYVLRRLNAGVKIVYTAPTGKAARRISESTGEKASTLHKKLGLGYKATKPTAFFEDVLFIDESSMNDTSLTSKLSGAMMNGRKVVFIGDVDQLPSVGLGAVLRDLIASNVVPVTMLTHTFRQDNNSTLFANICNIRNGIPSFKEGPDFHPLCMNASCTDQDIIQKILSVYQKEVAKYGREDVVVLVPFRKKRICSNYLNNHLQRLANKPTGGCYVYNNILESNRIYFQKNDLVMQLLNREECANGEVGTVTEVSQKGVAVDFNGTLVSYPPDQLDQLSLAYSMTVHKSQGSEYKSVIICMVNSHASMLTRNLLYTGVTRAKKECTVIYQEDALKKASATIAESSRITMLQEKLRILNEKYKAVYGS